MLEYVANSVWQVPMLAVVAWLAIRLGKPDAQMQHRVWVMTLALSVVLPLVGRGVFPIQSRMHSHPGLNRETRRQAEGGPSGTQAIRVPEHVSPVLRDGIAKNEQPALPFAVRLSPRAADCLLGIYCVIILLRLMQLAFARRTAGSLARRSIETTFSPSEQGLLERCCARLRVREPRVLVSVVIRTPMTVGVMRPTLLLPKAFFASTEREMIAILCHELAHVRCRDYLANWVCQLGSLPIGYHPATYGIQRQIRRTRELVCDAMAAETMDSSIEYARCLVTLAQRMRDAEGLPQSVQAAGLFDHDVFEERIMRLLEKKNTINVRAKAVRVMAGIAVMAAVTTAAAVFHVTPVVVRAAQRSGAPARFAMPVETANAMHVATPVEVALAMQTAAPVPMAVAEQAAPPAPSPIPQAPQAPPVHLAPVTPPASPTALPVPSEPIPPEAARQPTAVRQREGFDLTPEQRARIEAQMAAAHAQMREATKQMQSPEFKQRMADMQAQVAAATKQLQSAEVQRQMKMLQSPEFKKQMADMQAQMKDLNGAVMQWRMEMVNSLEFKKQMADMQAQVAAATKQLQSEEVQRQMKMLNSPEFNKEMADMQAQMKDLNSAVMQWRMEMLNSPEFKKQMADMQRSIEEATRKYESDSKRMHTKELDRANRPNVQSNPKGSGPE